jgi:potassium/hydrogen antiporter
MFAVDRVILVAAVLLLIGVTSSKFSSRVGVPVLILFLGLGMLAGSEGIGGIAFEDYRLAHAVGTLALVFILFDGGLSTSLASVRLAWRPALSLATVGVLVTSAATGAVASWLLGLPLLEGMLLGSIVGSTDAAAVFAVLRGRGLHLSPRVSATLEVESGSNDPMAVFLTVGLLEVLMGGLAPGWPMLGFFALQMGVGAAVGIGVGWGASHLVNRINLDAAGLYPILVAACGLFAFGLAASMGGSGFLAVYLAGIVLGNRRVVFHRGILLFHDGTAWLSQIGMFVVLGLVSFPNRLVDAARPGVLLALVLLLVARPLAVALSLLPFRFRAAELAFISWAGLRGAVPIVLATYPLLRGLPNAGLIFDVVFFAVVVSVLTQGLTLPWTARRLGLEVPQEVRAPVTLEITSLKHVDSDIVDYAVGPDSRAVGKPVRALALPEVAVVAMIARGGDVIPPRGSTQIEAGDHVFVVLRPEVRSVVDRIFGRGPAALQAVPELVEFPFQPTTTAGDIEEFYGIDLGAATGQTLAEILTERIGPAELRSGAWLQAGDVRLVVRGIADGRIEQVGLAIQPAPDPGGGDRDES